VEIVLSEFGFTPVPLESEIFNIISFSRNDLMVWLSDRSVLKSKVAALTADCSWSGTTLEATIKAAAKAE
jgi:hypothetical protein